MQKKAKRTQSIHMPCFPHCPMPHSEKSPNLGPVRLESGVEIAVDYVPAFPFLVLFGTATCSASLCLSLKTDQGERGTALLSNSSLFLVREHMVMGKRNL